MAPPGSLSESADGQVSLEGLSSPRLKCPLPDDGTWLGASHYEVHKEGGLKIRISAFAFPKHWTVVEITTKGGPLS